MLAHMDRDTILGLADGGSTIAAETATRVVAQYEHAPVIEDGSYPPRNDNLAQPCRSMGRGAWLGRGAARAAAAGGRERRRDRH